MKTCYSPGLSLFLVMAAGLMTGCQFFRFQVRKAMPVEDGAYYVAGGGGLVRGPARGSASHGVAGGHYVNPPVNIPRSVPPGSAIRYNSVATAHPLIAMTFDDGPHPSHTPRLLDILAQRNIKATFYVVGSRVASHPHIIARMVREGHEVANHTWNHPDLTKLSDAATRSELQRTAHAIYRACGIYPRTYRPPYGAITERHRRWIHREFGYPTIMWNVDPKDWQRPGPSVVASRLVSGARKGSILLAHDIHGSTVSAMPSALDRLLARGYRFVTVTQLINASTFATGSGETAGTGSVAVAAADGAAADGDGDDTASPVPAAWKAMVASSMESDKSASSAAATAGEMADKQQPERSETIAEAHELVAEPVAAAGGAEAEEP